LARGVGGIEVFYPANALLTNCTLVDNSSAHGTRPIAGVSAFGFDLFEPGQATIVNSILWHPSGDDIFVDASSGFVSMRFSEVNDAVDTGLGNNNISANPQFVRDTLSPSPAGEPAAPDFLITDCSPCLNTGTNVGAPANDIRGVGRPQLGGFDMGAYELDFVSDEDFDGVPDCRDQCLGTPGKEPVDANGCSCSQRDTQLPTITCPANLVVDCRESTGPEVTGSATASDNCNLDPGINFVDAVTAGPCAQALVIQRTWSAVDDFNNTRQCVQTITVEDTTDPQITCPDDVTIACGDSTDPTSTGLATGNDDCAEAVDVSFEDAIEGECPVGSAITRTWTVDDGCNQITCQQTITLEATDLDCNDNGIPDDQEADCDDNGVPDNCDIAAGAPDTDNDGVLDVCDICPGFNDKADPDGDGRPDGCDNCPDAPNPDQTDSDNDGTGDACEAAPPPSGGGSPVPPSAGVGRTDQNGTYNAVGTDVQGRKIGQVTFENAPPGESVTWAVTEDPVLDFPDDPPGPGAGTYAGFANGVGLGRTMSVRTSAPLGTFMVTVSITFSVGELEAVGVTPQDLQIHVLDDGVNPPVWVPVGVNIGESRPTGIVGQSGYYFEQDGRVTFWTVRDELSEFAVGAPAEPVPAEEPQPGDEEPVPDDTEPGPDDEEPSPGDEESGPGVEEPEPEPADADGDGVFDDADLCPDTLAGTEVDTDGCPVEEPPGEVVPSTPQCGAGTAPCGALGLASLWLMFIGLAQMKMGISRTRRTRRQ